MLKKIIDVLAGIKMTIVSAICLAVSLLYPCVCRAELPVDPAWASVLISGTPRLSLAIWRII